MKNFGKYVLGAALLAGGLGLGATSAQAAEFRIVVGGQSAYTPPCPGPGYVWVAGYYNDGYWVPGYWNYPSVGFVRDRGPVANFDRDRDRRFTYVDRDDHRGDRDDRGRDRDDRGQNRDRDRDSHFRH